MTSSVVMITYSGNKCATFCRGGCGSTMMDSIHPGMVLNDWLPTVNICKYYVLYVWCVPFKGSIRVNSTLGLPSYNGNLLIMRAIVWQRTHVHTVRIYNNKYTWLQQYSVDVLIFCLYYIIYDTEIYCMIKIGIYKHHFGN